jgi:hypothetical protein
MRFWIEMCPYKQVRVIHVDRELPRASCSYGILYESSEKGMAPEDAEMIRAMLALPGVIGLFVRRYEVQIEKERLFAWEDIQRGVLETIRDRYEPGGELAEADDAAFVPPMPTRAVVLERVDADEFN